MKRALMLTVVLLCAGQVFAESDTSELIQNAKTFAEIGDWENGLKLLEQYILRHPKDAEARLLLAECYYNWPDKQTQGEKVVDLNQDRGKAQIQVLSKLGDEGFEMLLKGLDSKTRDVHKECMYVLERKKDRRAIDALIRLAKEDRDRAEKAVYTMFKIESGRGSTDQRVSDFLISVLADTEPEYSLAVRRRAVHAIGALEVRDALPTIKGELQRVLREVPRSADRMPTRRLAAEEIVYIMDIIGRSSTAELEKELANVLRGIGASDFFAAAAKGAYAVSRRTLAHFSRAALEIVKADPGVAWNRQAPHDVEHFLEYMASYYPGVLLERGNKKRLHELLASPLPKDVRVGLAEIAAEIRDEGALPALFGKLNPYSADHQRVYGQWEGDGSREVWQAAEAISGEKALSFLVEKLRSDDMAWVAMAANLLKDRGDRKAAEALKERYLELKPLADRKGEAARYWDQFEELQKDGVPVQEIMETVGPPPAEPAEQGVLKVIRLAYKALTGKDIDGSGEGRDGRGEAELSPEEEEIWDMYESGEITFEEATRMLQELAEKGSSAGSAPARKRAPRSR